jgi:hypothetical protein
MTASLAAAPRPTAPVRPTRSLRRPSALPPPRAAAAAAELLVGPLGRGRRIAVELELRGEPVLLRHELLALDARFDAARVGILRVRPHDGHAFELRQLLLDLREVLAHHDRVDLRALGVLIRQDHELVRSGLGEAGSDGAALGLGALAVGDDPGAEGREERQVAREHTELAVHAGRRHLVDGREQRPPARRHDLELNPVAGHGCDQLLPVSFCAFSLASAMLPTM